MSRYVSEYRNTISLEKYSANVCHCYTNSGSPGFCKYFLEFRGSHATFLMSNLIPFNEEDCIVIPLPLLSLLDITYNETRDITFDLKNKSSKYFYGRNKSSSSLSI